MELLSDVFVKFWKEAIVAVLLMIVLPFIRRYVRRQRAKMINFFKEKKRLEQNLIEAEGKLKESQEEAERFRAEEWRKAQNDADSLREELTREQKAHQAETEEKLKAQSEIERLKSKTKSQETSSNSSGLGLFEHINEHINELLLRK